MNRPTPPRARRALTLAASTLVAASALLALGTSAWAEEPGTADAGSAVTVKGPVRGTVQAGTGSGLSVRSGTSTLYPRLEILPTGSRVTIQCYVLGQEISGNVRRSRRWDRLGSGRYVSDAFIYRRSSPPPCRTPPPVKVPARGWVRPVAYPAYPGFRTPERPNHDGVDIIAPRHTPIRAAAAGTVVTAECNASTDQCDVDGGLGVRGCGWYVEIRHSGNIVTRYCHLVRRPLVKVGGTVRAGQVIGYVGSSGNSSGPHLHFEVHTGNPATRANAVDPIPFMRRVGAPLT